MSNDPLARAEREANKKANIDFKEGDLVRRILGRPEREVFTVTAVGEKKMLGRYPGDEEITVPKTGWYKVPAETNQVSGEDYWGFFITNDNVGLPKTKAWIKEHFPNSFPD